LIVAHQVAVGCTSKCRYICSEIKK
jgi:hypothetical protein